MSPQQRTNRPSNWLLEGLRGAGLVTVATLAVALVGLGLSAAFALLFR